MSEQTGAPDSQPSIEDRVANALFGPDSPEDEQQNPEPDLDEGDEVEQPEAQDAAPPEGSTEIEIEGRKYKPEEIKEAFLRREDYTRKTQEVAERSRLLVAHEQVLQQRAAFEEQTAEKREQLRDLQAQLAQFKQIDWSQLDTDSIVRAKTRQDAIRDQLSEVQQSLQSEWQKFNSDFDKQRKEVLMQGQKYLQTTIPGWNEERAQKVAKQALSEGFTEHQLAAIDQMQNPMAPLIVKLLDKAARLEELESKGKAALEKAKGAPPVVKPGATDPALSKRMQTLNFRKQVKSAPNQATKNALIMKRLEQKFG